MRKIVRRFSAYGMQWDIYEDGGFRCLTVEDGGKINMKELTLNDRINGRIELNKYSINAWCTNYNLAKQFTDNNDLLGELAEYIKSHNDIEYERGLNDAWELARKIVSLSPQEGGYSCYDMHDIFGPSTLREISDKFTVQEALAKAQEYEKKKAEEEANKLVPGDVVEYFSCTTRATAPKSTGIFIHEDLFEQVYWILPSYGGCPQKLSKDIFKLRKTGEHIDFNYIKIGGSDD